MTMLKQIVYIATYALIHTPRSRMKGEQKTNFHKCLLLLQNRSIKEAKIKIEMYICVMFSCALHKTA